MDGGNGHPRRSMDSRNRNPLKILRIQSGTEQTWGIDFERIIRRKNEFTYWNNYSRDFFFEQISQAGHLVGLVDLSKGEAWRISLLG